MNSFKSVFVSLLVLMSSGASFADSLRSEKIGALSVWVSDTNQWVYVRPLAQLQVFLMEHAGLPDAKRFSINLNGEVSVDETHADVQKIKAKYPAYQLEFAGASAAVESCSAKLSDGTAIECSVPPATGSYFSGLQMLTRAQGELLRTSIQNGGGIELMLQVRELVPFVVGSESISFSPSSVCRSVGVPGSRVTLEHLMAQVAVQVAPQVLRLKSKMLARTLAAKAIQACALLSDTGSIEDLSEVRSFAELLERRVVLKSNVSDLEVVTRQEIAQRLRLVTTPVAIRYQVEGSK